MFSGNSLGPVRGKRNREGGLAAHTHTIKPLSEIRNVELFGELMYLKSKGEKFYL